jgi:CHAT domain-containing protein
MADVAAYYAASAIFDQHLTGARQELQQLLGAVDADRHPALAAEIEWEIAVSANADGDWGSAVRNADDAVAKLRRLGERRSAAFVDSVSAIAYEMMGDRDLAWNRRIHSFEALSQIGAHQQLNTVLHLATITLRPLEQRPAAVALSDLIAEDAQKDPYVFTEVLAERAQNALQAADSRSARVFLEQGRRLLPKITDSSLRESAKAQVNLADARLATVRDPHRALAILNESIPLLASGRLSRFLPEAYLQRGRAYRQLGNQDAALMDCNLAMEQIEKQDASIRDPESHLNFLDTAAQIVDETIDLQLSRGAIADAFSTADRSRTLNDPLAIRPDRIAVPPRGMAVIEYVVRPRALTIFCVAQGVISAETVRIEPRELALDLEAFAEGIRNRVPMDEVRGRGAILYRRLIAPVRPQLAGIKEIVFVPDQQLYAIPFAALWDEHENRYLVEQYVIRFAPAARVHSGEEKTISPALVIADPPALHSPPLLASRDEASRIATLHGAVLLTGDAATRASFEKLAPSSALIHFAGHANSDAGESYGALLFAPGNGDSGVLSSGEIARLSLTRHPLVVLAACGTFRGNSAHVAGMSSLARSFLIAGARGVVGTLWEIDDDVSAPLFTQFHEQLRTGEPPAQALKAIQIAAIHSRDSRTAHPATWSPIELLGYQ